LLGREIEQGLGIRIGQGQCVANSHEKAWWGNCEFIIVVRIVRVESL
jgi:hypothetical protein